MNLENLRIRQNADQINALPLRQYTGEVQVIRTFSQWRSVLPNLMADGLLGFDTETRPTFRKGKLNAPALIQLATASKVYIVQLGWLPFGAHFADLLANPDIIKVGVSIRDDMNALARIFPFEPAGLVDLGELARKNDLPNQGLRTLAASFFGWRISKGLQCSNWSTRQLSPGQIAYAATDAWISRLLYLRFKELGLDASGFAA